MTSQDAAGAGLVEVPTGTLVGDTVNQFSLDCGGGNTSVSVAILLGYCSYSGALGYFSQVSVTC